MGSSRKGGFGIIEPFSVRFDLEQGIMADPERTTLRRASDMRGYYSEPEALERLIEEENDPVHYEVFERPVPEEPGHMMCCISRLQPGLIGREHFMTKGHYHAVMDTAEIYMGLAGRGCLLMKTENGMFRSEPISRGRMVYVPPYWAHRSVNTGSEPLVSLCVYPAHAGHDYGGIQHEGFPKRVVDENGKTVLR